MRKFFWKLRCGVQRFMQGRYGGDKLNTTLIWTAFITFLVSLFIPVASVQWVLLLLYYFMLGWAVFRMLSRNTYKRYRENRRFLLILDRIRDRKHKYYSCPRCHQPVRVPKGKGKIAITCPKCRERFVKKT